MNQDKKTIVAQLFKNVFTYEHLTSLTDEINNLSKLLYVDDKLTFLQKIAKRTSKELYSAFCEADRNKILPQTPAEIGNFLQSLIAYLKSIPRVNLFLPFDPSDDFIGDLAVWFERNIGQKVILNIRVQEEIIAGAIIEYNGKYKDYSKASQIEAALASIK